MLRKPQAPRAKREAQGTRSLPLVLLQATREPLPAKFIPFALDFSIFGVAMTIELWYLLNTLWKKFFLPLLILQTHRISSSLFGLLVDFYTNSTRKRKFVNVYAAETRGSLLSGTFLPTTVAMTTNLSSRCQGTGNVEVSGGQRCTVHIHSLVIVAFRIIDCL